eukprot:g9727.t1
MWNLEQQQHTVADGLEYLLLTKNNVVVEHAGRLQEEDFPLSLKRKQAPTELPCLHTVGFWKFEGHVRIRDSEHVQHVLAISFSESTARLFGESPEEVARNPEARKMVQEKLIGLFKEPRADQQGFHVMSIRRQGSGAGGGDVDAGWILASTAVQWCEPLEMGWFCRCRRLPKSDDLILEVPSSRDVSPVTPAKKDLVATPRHPRRTRIFVRMPSGEIIPADMDLNWTTTEASEYIIANCRNVGLKGLENGCNLRFRRRILRKDLTLKESGAEIGSVLGLVPSEPLQPFQVPSSCTASSELALTCLNNRAACFQQLKQHDLVVRDTSEVIKQQPANLKALLRRMVALDAAGRQEEALQERIDVLTLEPKNHHALQVVARKRQNLNKKATDWLPPTTPDASVIVFWQAAERSCMHSYQLLQALPELKVPRGQLVWMEVGKGRLFENFSRSVGRLSVEGIRSLMILSDTAVFHSDVDLSAATAVLSDRSDTFAVRLDLNPRVEYFPKNQLCASAPHLKPFAKDERLVLWTRKFDATKQAYEAVPRESGWDEILDWTASLVRAQQISHFFSALQGQQVETIQQMDDKAADWLSRRQRMKRSEVSHRSACFVQPLLVSLDPEIFGPPKEADALLRRTLHESWKDRLPSLAKQLSWSEAEVGKYFEGFPSSDRDSSVECLQCLLDPLRYRDHYLDSVQIGSAPKTGLPQQLSDTPLVSWLIPARNCEYFILDCLRSIEKQVGLTPGCYEVDASEDRTDAVLQNFAKTRPYVRIIESDGVQQGVSGSLQVGWSHCRGSYITRLDADDEADPHRLLKQLRFLEQHPEVSVVGVVAAVWREFHGQQTSRAREQICLAQRGEDVVLMDGPAEYSNCRLLRIGDESMVVSPERWQEALATPGTEVLLLRSDPCEPASGGSFWHHPSILRMGCIFEDALIGTTLCFRRAHFQEGETGRPFAAAMRFQTGFAHVVRLSLMCQFPLKHVS